MTGVAVAFGRAVDWAQVAFLALNGSMHANQWKIGKVVIEKDIVVPTFFVVAVIAAFALLALMDIVLSMAGYAVSLQLVFLNFALVAIRTR